MGINSGGLVPGGGSGAVGTGTISDITSSTLTITNSTGPTVNIESSGGGGGVQVRAFPIAYDTAGLATGYSLYTPTVDDILLDAWVEIDTAWDGLSPLCDFGTFVPGPRGCLSANASGPWDMTVADGESSDNHGLFGTDSPTSYSANIISNGIGVGPPAARWYQKFIAANPVKVVVSQDGTSAAAVAANSSGNNAPSTPVTVVTGVNDEFVYTPHTTGTPETFTVAPGVYTTGAACAAAMGAALGGSSEAFSTLVLVAVDGGGVLGFTQVVAGAAFNASTIGPGANDVTADMGFTGTPLFSSGAGGSPAASQGAAIFYLVTSTPV